MPTPLRARLRALLLLLPAVLLAGCAVTVGTGDGGSAGSGNGGSTGSGDGGSDDGGSDSTTGSDNPIGQVDRDDLGGDERSAVGATDAYWRRAFPEAFRGSYRSPEIRGGYVGTNGPTCGDQPSVAFNAFYCPSEDFLAWDENLMAAGYEKIGDAWVYLIIAHEWGHAIQARLQADRVSVEAELQADCFAGATLFGAADRGLLEFERGDTQELAETLRAVADDYPWTKETDHGDAQQRTNAFNEGASGGPTACIS